MTSPSTIKNIHCKTIDKYIEEQVLYLQVLFVAPNYYSTQKIVNTQQEI